MKIQTPSFFSNLFFFFVLFFFDVYGYELIENRFSVTPGCEGGVLYSKIESGIVSSVSKHEYLNAENMKSIFEEGEDLISEKKVNK